MKPVDLIVAPVDSGIEAELRARDTPVVIPSRNDPDRWLDDTYVEFCSKDEVKIRQARLDAAEAKRAKRRARNLKEKP